jgi:hypothetical protein
MQTQVEDLYGTIVGEGSTLGNLLAKIPGLRGYMERSRRREADQLLRDTISARLEQIRLQLSGVHQELGRNISQGIIFAEDLGRADNLLMGLIGKIKDAPQGYAGFFDAVKVKEEDLAQIYAFDEQMLNTTDQIGADVAALEKATYDSGDIGAALRELTADLRLGNETFSARQEVLSGVRDGESVESSESLKE